MLKDGSTFKYKFSIVMSVFNVEPYIEAAVESVIAQDIGFENIQIVFVDDGSTDSSGQICDRYHEAYPSNTLVIHKENKGLASARNEGLDHVEGRFVNFFDPDDILEPSTLSYVYDFFNTHEGDVDMVTIPLHFFEAATGLHPKYEFMGESSRIVNLIHQPYNFILSSAGSFYKQSVFATNRFDETLKREEDSNFNLKLFSTKPQFGYVCQEGARYNYRRRAAGTSLVNGDKDDPQAMSLLKKVLDPLFSQTTPLLDWQKEFVIYELRSRIKNFNTDFDNQFEDFERIKEMWKPLLKQISSEFILYRSKFILNQQAQLCFLQLIDSSFQSEVDRCSLCISNRLTANVREAKIEKGKLCLEAWVDRFGVDSVDLALLVDSSIKRATISRDIHTSFDIHYGSFSLDTTHYRRFEIDLTSVRKITFILVEKDGMTTHSLKQVHFKESTPFANRYRGVGLFDGNGHRIRRVFDTLEVQSASKDSIYRKIRMILHFGITNKYWAFGRIFSKSTKRFILINDRPNKAGDNGEALFRYINENRSDLKDQTYYVLAKNSSDYKRLKSIGHVVEPGSILHKYLFINSKLICTSHNAKLFFLPWKPSLERYYADLMSNDYVWLQHGVTMNDISSGANRLSAHTNYIVSCTEKETEELLQEKYFFGSKRILKTGFPRYDYLQNNPDGTITICPTWRSYLSGEILPNGSHAPSDNFSDSNYYREYGSLLSNPRLIDKLRLSGTRIKFLLHPGMMSYRNLFLAYENDVVSVVKPEDVNYSEVFEKSSLLITDYSSVAFDFAYLEKPVLYFQFDRTDFFSKHYKRGYYDFQTQGFGDIAEDHSSLINLIERSIDSGFTMSDKYIARKRSSFLHDDRLSCERLLKALEDIDLL